MLWLGLHDAGGRYRLAGLTLAAAALSAILMALLYQPGVDPTRVYEGTDTRAFGLLLGAALAMALIQTIRSRGPSLLGAQGSCPTQETRSARVGVARTITQLRMSSMIPLGRSPPLCVRHSAA